MTVNALIEHLKRYAASGSGELVVWLRADKYTLDTTTLAVVATEPLDRGCLVLILEGDDS